MLSAIQNLQANDKARFDAFLNQGRALQFLTGRMLIEKYISPDYQTLETGKIVLQKGFVSVAHSKNFVVLAFDDEPIGIDIEKITNRKDFQTIAKRMKFKNCNTPYDFFKSWTAYEADFKCDAPKKRKTHLFIDHQGFLICVSSLGSKPLEIQHAQFK